MGLSKMTFTAIVQHNVASLFWNKFIQKILKSWILLFKNILTKALFRAKDSNKCQVQIFKLENYE